MDDALHSQQLERAAAFRDLHRRDRPLRLANAWSATSAVVTAAYLSGELHPPMEAVGAGFGLLPRMIR